MTIAHSFTDYRSGFFECYLSAMSDLNTRQCIVAKIYFSNAQYN